MLGCLAALLIACTTGVSGGGRAIAQAADEGGGGGIAALVDELLENKAQLVRQLTVARDALRAARALQDDPGARRDPSAREGLQARVAGAEADVRRAEEAVQRAEEALTDRYRELRGRLGAAGDGDGILRPGDSVEVYVREDESFNGTYLVRSGGYVLLPRVGRVHVAGLDLGRAEDVVRQALEVEQLRSPSVVVERPEQGGGVEGPVYFLAGEFARPGLLTLAKGTVGTLVNVVLQSGGLTEYADPSRIRLLRLMDGREVVEELDLERILSEGKGLASDVPLRPGDILVVPPRPVLVHVTGSVAQPGSVRFLPGETMTAYVAILRSGGFNRFANRRRAYVLRDGGDGRKERLDVDFRAVQRARSPDVVLRSGDIIIVPERFLSF